MKIPSLGWCSKCGAPLMSWFEGSLRTCKACIKKHGAPIK